MTSDGKTRSGGMVQKTGITLPQHVGEAAEVNYSGPPAADYGPLARDRIPVRSMAERDLRALVAIDRRITGRDRAGYFKRKLADALTESDVCVSLIAELDTVPVGFIMALSLIHISEPTRRTPISYAVF